MFEVKIGGERVRDYEKKMNTADEKCREQPSAPALFVYFYNLRGDDDEEGGVRGTDVEVYKQKLHCVTHLYEYIYEKEE